MRTGKQLNIPGKVGHAKITHKPWVCPAGIPKDKIGSKELLKRWKEPDAFEKKYYLKDK